MSSNVRTPASVLLCAALSLVAAHEEARAHGGEARGHERGAEPPSVRALRIDEPIRIDGVLDEAAWERAGAATGFTQREPRPGAPASEPTFIRVLFDDEALYVGIDARDSEPDRIIAREMGRDVSLFRDDSVIILLDTFHDHRNIYFFETNPNSSQTDSLITDEGRDTNFEWDGVWSVRARRTGSGWTAEMRIPFAGLRFDPALSTWGLNVRRLIRRRNEEVFWSPIPLDADLFRISLGGHLTGLSPPDPGLNLWLKPFVTGTAGTSYLAADGGDPDDSDGGVDVKWGIGRNLSLDLTYNTDFAETEVDDLRVNLTRFSLFFPEQREFFLENAGIFEFGFEERGFGPPLLKPFFSRRIGLGSDGREIPIEWGTRLTGRAGAWNFGLLGARTETVRDPIDPDVPANTWGAARVKRNVGERSSVGMLVTSRHASGDDFNRVYGLDASILPRQELSFDLFGLASDTPGRSGGEWAAGAAAAWSGSIWDWSVDYYDVGRNFNPETGFLLRSDVRRYFSRVNYEPRPESPRIRNFEFTLESTVFDRHDGPVESANLFAKFFGIRFENENEFSLWWNWEEERIFAPFAIRPGIVIPPGTYRFPSYSLVTFTNDAAPLWVRWFLTAGEFFDGDRIESDISLGWRPGRRFRTVTTWELRDVRLPAGDFEINVYRQRFDVSFTAELGASLFAQYNEADDLLSVNARLQWRYRPGSDLFIVFNENWDAPDLGDRVTRDRRIIVKIAHLFQF